MATLPNPLPKLASDPSGRSLGLQLPPGVLLDTTYDGPADEPLLWHAGRDVSPGNWAALGAPAARVGLLPLLVDVGSTQGGLEHWHLRPGQTSYPGDHEAEEVLASYWDEYAAYEAGAGDDHPGRDKVVELFGEPATYEEQVAPFGPDWPGLAPAGVLAADPDVRAAGVADALSDGRGDWFKQPRLALVPARRSADIPAAIGWSGPVNYESDVARLCAVLRSWEDRFGIRVVALGFDILVVSVAAPPTTLAEAEAVAAEHFAFCPDNVVQGEAETLRAYAEELVGERVWSFWWD
ncbi:DUF4253 domain-containing protein [Streptomyces sp. NPDC096152]|uniref:DUF4253 domain-containing protein n=1 Tax=Streptomyces sp. NPDC096152 TaxID=3366078 RepID=UPI00380AFAFB